MVQQGNNTQSRINAARQAGLSDAEILQGMKESARYKASFDQARKAGLSDADIARDLGLQITIKVQAEKPAYQPYDWKADQKKNMREHAKDAGPTKAWESALLGFSDLGSGVIQGALYAKDKAFGGNSYNKFTKQRADIENYHEMRRQESNQGFDGWRLVGNVVGTAPLGAAGKGFQGAKILSQAGAKVLAQNAGVGAAIGGSGFAENANQRTANTILGGVGGAGGAAAGQKIGEGLTGLVRRLNPNTATSQQIDTVINVSLSQSDDAAIRNIKVTDLDATAREALRKQVRSLLKQGKTPDAKTLERTAVFNELRASGVDFKPTGKQATGNPNLWTKESELAKLDGAEALNNRYIQQHETFAKNINDLTDATGGTSVNSRGTGESILSALSSQDNARKQIISDLYQTAKNHTGNDLLLDSNAILNNASRLMDEGLVLPEKAMPLLKLSLKEFLPNPNNPSIAPKPFTLRDKELVVKRINDRLSKTKDDDTRHALGLIRDSLEQETDDALARVGTTLQGDAKTSWEAARQSARDRFKLIERTPALQKAIDDAAPDRIFENSIISKSVPYRDVKALADEIKSNPEAMNNVRLEMMRYIASHSVAPQSGAISPAGMRRALDNIGEDKLKLFFSADEVKHLTNLRAAAKYLHSQPVGSNVNNSNSTSAFMKLLGYMDILKKIPVVGKYASEKAQAVPRGVNAQIKISQGSNALQNTATRTPSIRDQQTTKWLMQMGLLGGANAANE